MDKKNVPVEEIAKAVSGAVMSVLSKISRPSTPDSGEDFLGEQPFLKLSGKGKHKAGLPTAFLRHVDAPKKERIYTYERDIICLPRSYDSKVITIPRNRVILSEAGLMGKISLASNMTEEEIFAEIRSVFRVPMRGQVDFPFLVLQPTGGSSRTLTVPAVSSSFKWTAGATASRNTKTPIYILAMDKLQGEENVLDSEDEELPVIKVSSKEPKKIDANASTSNYRTYGDLLDYDWSSSPTPPPFSPISPIKGATDSVSDVIEDHRKKFLSKSDDKVRLIIRRKHVFDDALHKVKNGIDVNRSLKITFVDEPAVDAGGPLREFFHILLESMSQNNNLFSGPLHSHVLCHNVAELQRKTFYYVGVFISMSIVHGGPAPMFFSPAVADYILLGVERVKATIADVPDPQMQQLLQKVLECNSSEELQDLMLTDEFDFRYCLGVATNVKSLVLSEKERIVGQLATHYAILQSKGELDQLLCGMSETLGVLNMVRENPVVMRPLFVSASKPHLSAEKVYDMFKMYYSKEGSNDKEKEELTAMRWFSFLESVDDAKGNLEIEGDKAFSIFLEDILIFTTGVPTEPPLGFTPVLNIRFTDNVYPRANTCINAQYLPLLHSSQEEFTRNMAFGIMNSAGFGFV